MDGGSGARLENTSGWAGASKLADISSTLTASLGAVGSIRSGSLWYRNSCDR
jgi:hypothetical protein